MLVAVALAAGTVPLFGGRLSALAELQVRWGWTVLLALVLQVAATVVVPGASAGVLAAVHVVSLVLGGAFVAANLRVPGLPVIALGAALNAAAILANGGVMPARAGALARAGVDATSEEFRNSTLIEDARLAFLGDVFAWPAPLPLANVFSVGDIVLVVGAALFLHGACGSRLRLPRRRRP